MYVCARVCMCPCNACILVSMNCHVLVYVYVCLYVDTFSRLHVAFSLSLAQLLFLLFSLFFFIIFFSLL